MTRSAATQRNRAPVPRARLRWVFPVGQRSYSVCMYFRPDGTPTPCPVTRRLDVVGGKWSLLIERSAVCGQTRFNQFCEGLGIPTDISSALPATLVTGGVLGTRPYREPGSLERSGHHLTPAGQGLPLALAALVQRSDEFNPDPNGAGSHVDAETGAPAHAACLDGDGRPLPGVAMVSGPATHTAW